MADDWATFGVNTRRSESLMKCRLQAFCNKRRASLERTVHDTCVAAVLISFVDASRLE
jgi:hypothetical protein